MKSVVKKREAKIIDEHGVSKFAVYDLPFNSFSTGVSEIHGRYPQSGYDVDLEVEASWYVVSGSGQVWIEDKSYDVQEGDLVLVPRGKKYWINGSSLKIVVTSSPKWTPEQHQHID